jgi:hypothetical protein
MWACIGSMFGSTIILLRQWTELLLLYRLFYCKDTHVITRVNSELVSGPYCVVTYFSIGRTNFYVIYLDIFVYEYFLFLEMHVHCTTSLYVYYYGMHASYFAISSGKRRKVRGVLDLADGCEHQLQGVFLGKYMDILCRKRWSSLDYFVTIYFN